MSDELQQAIADMEEARQSHENWADYFERFPEVEKSYLETGEWDSGKVHREWVEKYDRVLSILKKLKGTVQCLN